MLTEEMVREGYFERHSREMSEENLEAFLKLCRMFNCLDSNSYLEAMNRIAEITLIKAGVTQLHDRIEIMWGKSPNSYVN